MLEKLIEKSKNFIKKAKKPLIGVLAGLTLLYSSSGCTSMGTKWKTTKTYQETIEKREFTKDLIIYKINEHNFENNILTVPVTEVKTIEKYKEREIITKEKQQEYDFKKIKGAVIGGWIGFVLGTTIGYSIGYSVSPKTEYYSKQDNWPCPLLTTTGLIMGIAIGSGIGRNHNKIKESLTGHQRTIITNKTTVTELIDEEIKKEKPAETYVLITNKNLKFQDWSDLEKLPQKEVLVYSFNGNAKVKVIEDIVEFEFEKKDLIEQIKRWKQIKQIKEPTRSELLPSILDYIVNKDYKINIETIKKNTEFKKIKNDQKTISVSGYQLPIDKVYLVLEDFINKEINSKIKEVRIKVKDESTHTSVKRALLEINTRAPTKTGVAKQYFEDELLRWSTKKITNYVNGKEVLKYDDNGVAVFPAYTLSNYNTETTNPKYRFVNLNFDFSDGKLKKTIYMSKDPKLIRIIDE